MNYLQKLDEIISILKKAEEYLFIKQIENAKLSGGTGGEILAIVCSLFKTYEIQESKAFGLIKSQAYELYQYAESIGLYPSANFTLLDELSN